MPQRRRGSGVDCGLSAVSDSRHKNTGISPSVKESTISVVTILIIVILVLLAIYLARRVL